MSIDTSKHGDSSTTVHGHHGAFLASLGALSLLSITSRHRAYRSHNTLVVHRSQVVSRLTPAPPQDDVFGSHGSRVSVRDLFGNMPVRVKQRAVGLEVASEDERQWEYLRRTTTGLLLAWCEPVFITIKDVRKDRKIRVGRRASSQGNGSSSAQKDTKLKLDDILSMLSQAGYVSPDIWSSWIPISGSTTLFAIKGAVSTEPAPSKQTQFIAIDIEPLVPHLGHSVLYDHINKIFNNSNFGTIEDEAEVDEAEKDRRRQDGRFKSDGYTHKQLKGHKGIDRWPMFFLQISFRCNSLGPSASSSDLLGKETNVHAITKVLNAMLLEWLTAHRFRPRMQGLRHQVSRPSSESPPENHSSSLSQTTPTSQLIAAVPNAATAGPKRQRPRLLKSPKTVSEGVDLGAIHSSRYFSEWNRIKSGKPEFYEKAWGRSEANHPEEKSAQQINGIGRPRVDRFPLSFCAQPILPGQLNRQDIPSPHSRWQQAWWNEQNNRSVQGKQEQPSKSATDEAVEWEDPRTQERVQLDGRTGVTLNTQKSRAEPGSEEDNAQLDETSRQQARKTRVPQRLTKGSRPSSTGQPKESSLFTKFLNCWDNPVFEAVEERIPQVLPNDLNLQEYHRSPAQEIEQAFQDSLVFSGKRLSRDALRAAHVLAQVDKKFILVKMLATVPPSENADVERGRQKHVLVLIDQHAADERCKVEGLLQDLCIPNKELASNAQSSKPATRTINLDPPIKFEIPGSEKSLFQRRAQWFASWGIVCDIVDNNKPLDETRPASRPASRPVSGLNRKVGIVVKALPSAIAERCRLEPKHLINLMRSEIWKDNAPPLRSNDRNPITGSHLWLHCIGSCPRGMLDLINSRACRSAIMFNDQLSLSECQALVKRLANCAFPFQCAHGRPSMVPLVDLGNGDGGGIELDDGLQGTDLSRTQKRDRGFREVWREWKNLSGDGSSP